VIFIKKNLFLIIHIGVFMDWLQNLEKELEVLKVEYAKFISGNRTAGTRARKHLQNIKRAAQELRSSIQNSKKEEEDT
jgi:hypothetical protein